MAIQKRDDTSAHSLYSAALRFSLSSKINNPTMPTPHYSKRDDVKNSIGLLLYLAPPVGDDPVGF